MFSITCGDSSLGFGCIWLQFPLLIGSRL
jgi:hypothetical protein